ncbi:MAG: 3',5'-cyclic-nucleotide phosphodiesterase [Nevskiaceae bacterium]|nr:MAG: 3',5'-cyclic-nucleotide phosphodiesterase [Nevskiaceae bacterium]TBR74758.1 MAG: 3',5'-cyclic-nucleotide phosphodiesterase [Nevskiaceae bacterium]
MKIDILGCSGGVGPGLRTTSLRVDGRILIDAGTGACDLPLVDMVALTDVFLTHAHLDHTVGLAFLADNRIGQSERPLVIHGQAETIDRLHAHLFNWQVWPDFTLLPDAGHPTLCLVADAEAPVICGGLRMIPFPAVHTVPANGYAVEHAHGIFAFTGDTGSGAEPWAALNTLPRLDQLMVEVSYGNARDDIAAIARHLTPARLAAGLARLHHRPEVLLTHAKPGHEQAVREECRAALAGWRYRHLCNGETLEV